VSEFVCLVPFFAQSSAQQYPNASCIGTCTAGPVAPEKSRKLFQRCWVDSLGEHLPLVLKVATHTVQAIGHRLLRVAHDVLRHAFGDFCIFQQSDQGFTDRVEDLAPLGESHVVLQPFKAFSQGVCSVSVFAHCVTRDLVATLVIFGQSLYQGFNGGVNRDLSDTGLGVS
jgi:hypothetical protein